MNPSNKKKANDLSRGSCCNTILRLFFKMQSQLSEKIVEYHRNGFIESLRDLYFKKMLCSENPQGFHLQVCFSFKTHFLKDH